MTEERASTRHEERERCPVCGRGFLTDFTCDCGGDQEGRQTASSRELKLYTCGHEVAGPSLDLREEGGADLDVERRHAEDTIPSVK